MRRRETDFGMCLKGPMWTGGTGVVRKSTRIPWSRCLAGLLGVLLILLIMGERPDLVVSSSESVEFVMG